MNIEEFKDIMIEELSKNKISTDCIDYNLFFQYMKMILEWNEKINLTAIKDEKEFIVKHFIDSLSIVEYINNEGKIIDIGTGAGFPGIPVKLSRNKVKVTLLDSVSKKINVIKDVTDKLEIKDVELIHSRVEDIAHNVNYREKYDYVTSRAVSNLTTLAEYMLPLVKVGGIAICMKGPNYEEEIEQSKRAMALLGGKIENVDTKKISNDYDRTIVIIRKEKSTPKQYPRGKGKPLKEPLY